MVTFRGMSLENFKIETHAFKTHHSRFIVYPVHAFQDFISAASNQSE